MKSPVRIAIAAFLVVSFARNLFADSTWVYAVQISATVQAAPPRITLRWEPDPYGANNYTVYRKSKDASSWGAGTPLPGSASTFTDNNVSAGAAYEYAVIKSGALGYTGYGYIYAGIQAPLIENRGTIVLVIDNTYISQLASELTRLQGDLAGDGWTVVRRDVSRNDSPANVRSVIQGVYYADPGNVKAVFLFGHVPILRSGNLNVDGHQARPMPADAFYGDMDGGWSNPSFLPSDVELMVGRVDLSNMPGAGAPAPWPSELELLRNYLNKDHNWRHLLHPVPRRALLGNRFGDFGGEAFAASGFRNFGPLVGPGNTVLANEQDAAPVSQKWSSMLAAGPYLWAYGCGGGSYTSMSGMGTHGTYGDVWSTDIVNGNAQAVFFMMFGSWLGEWDSADNIMRSVLATPTLGLTCSWAGRPHWFYHHMALGEPIGYSTRLTQNNGGLYQNQVNQNLRGIHIALMGDPTLRLHPVAPPSALTSASSRGAVNLSWHPSPDAVLGYHVYRASSINGPFTRVNTALSSATSFVDTSGAAGNFVYMVRAVKLEETPSGTYFNPSQGIFANVASSPTPPPATNPPPVISAYWIDDTLPAGAVAGAEGGDAWQWVSSNPTPFSGTLASQSTLATGMHQHYFDWAANTLTVNSGDALFAYVYLDPLHPPSEVMLQWNDGTWEHRAYWGANSIPAGLEGTSARFYAGPLPQPGKWIRLEVRAAQVGLQGRTVKGMAFGLFDGRATWDAAGKTTQSTVPAPAADGVPPSVTITAPLNHAVISGASVPIAASATDNLGVIGVQFKLDGANLGGEDLSPPYTVNLNTATLAAGTHYLTAVARDAASNRSTSPLISVTVNQTLPATSDTVWFDDVLPLGAVAGADGGDAWNWISQSPLPFSGTTAHQSNLSTGSHQHFFRFAWERFPIMTGDILVAYVYLDPATPPSEVMLQWNDGSWEHRAYWGESLDKYGTEGTPSRYFMGPLPTLGKWVRLEVPARLVGLEGSSLDGIAFTLFGGRAAWDHVGKR